MIILPNIDIDKINELIGRKEYPGVNRDIKEKQIKANKSKKSLKWLNAGPPNSTNIGAAILTGADLVPNR